MVLDENNLPILSQFSDDGFIDCIFRIDQLDSDRDHYYFNLLASHEGERLGMAVQMIKSVGPGFDHEMNLVREHVYRGGVTFKSLGSVSDRLVIILSQLYGLHEKSLRMAAEVGFTAIALHQADTDFEHHSVKLKLFGRDQEPFGEHDYYESIFNVNLADGFVSWNEKDPDYRTPLIRGISAA